jgi:hypothetical protein
VDGVLAALLTDIVTAQAELGPALDPGRARTLLLASARLFAAIDDTWQEAMVLGALGWLDTGRGDFTAADLFERAYVLARELDDEVATAHAATNLTELRIAQRRFDEARELLGVAIAAYDAVRLYDGASYGLEAAALVAREAGNDEDAARLLGAAEGLRSEAGIPIWGPRLTRFEALKGSVRRGLGDEAFGTAWEEGRALGFEGSLGAARRAVA